MDPAQDGHEPEDRPGRPRLRYVRAEIRCREARGHARHAGEQLWQPRAGELLRGVEERLGDLSGLGRVPVAPESAGERRVVVRPDGSALV